MTSSGSGCGHGKYQDTVRSIQDPAWVVKSYCIECGAMYSEPPTHKDAINYSSLNGRGIPPMKNGLINIEALKAVKDKP